MLNGTCGWCGEEIDTSKVHHIHGEETVHDDCVGEFRNSRGLALEVIEDVRSAVKKIRNAIKKTKVLKEKVVKEVKEIKDLENNK